MWLSSRSTKDGSLVRVTKSVDFDEYDGAQNGEMSPLGQHHQHHWRNDKKRGSENLLDFRKQQECTLVPMDSGAVLRRLPGGSLESPIPQNGKTAKSSSQVHCRMKNLGSTWPASGTMPALARTALQRCVEEWQIPGGYCRVGGDARCKGCIAAAKPRARARLLLQRIFRAGRKGWL